MATRKLLSVMAQKSLNFSQSQRPYTVSNITPVTFFFQDRDTCIQLSTNTAFHLLLLYHLCT